MTPVNAIQGAGHVNRNKTFNLKLVYLNVQCLRSKLNLVSAFLEKGQPDFFFRGALARKGRNLLSYLSIEGHWLAPYAE